MAGRNSRHFHFILKGKNSLTYDDSLGMMVLVIAAIFCIWFAIDSNTWAKERGILIPYETQND